MTDFVIKTIIILAALGFVSGIGLAIWFENVTWLWLSLVTGIFFMAG